MKSILVSIVAAILLVGCGKASNTEADKALLTAVWDGNIEDAKQAINDGANVNIRDDNPATDGTTPLLSAVYRNHKEIVELLIDKGADLEARPTGGPNKRNTPLDLAIKENHTKIADLLLKRGASTNRLDRFRKTTTTAAVPREGSGKALDIPIWKAVSTKNIEAVKQHLAAGEDVNGGPLGGTPLHYTYVDFDEIAELLLANGANVNAKDDDGKTTLDWVGSRGRMADLLRKHGGKTSEELKAEGK